METKLRIEKNVIRKDVKIIRKHISSGNQYTFLLAISWLAKQFPGLTRLNTG